MPPLPNNEAWFGFTGMIEPAGVSRIAAALNAAANEGTEVVHLEFSSNGGYVADGIYLYNHIRALPLTVAIYNTGSVSSIAVAVFLSAAERYCSRHAMFMIHPTTMGASEMTARRLQSSLDAALADDERTDEILRERSTIPESVLLARRHSEVHISPGEAVEFGLVQGVREFVLPKGQQIVQL